MKSKGFTLLELITVVVIAGILIVIAVPQYFKITERGKAVEAIEILNILKKAQLRYAVQQGATSDNITKLDAEYTDSKYFAQPVLVEVLRPADNLQQRVASVSRDVNVDFHFSGRYWLQINGNGNITCRATGTSCEVCNMLGYGTVCYKLIGMYAVPY